MELAQPGAQSWNWWSLKPLSADSPNMVTPKPAVVQLFFPINNVGMILWFPPFFSPKNQVILEGFHAFGAASSAPQVLVPTGLEDEIPTQGAGHRLIQINMGWDG